MAAKQPPRKRIPPDVEAAVLNQSRRRCALCFHLHGDTKTKKGQVAHLDHRRANSIEDNLAFLCLDHHTDYDSITSQHKNYTIHEVKVARGALYRWVQKGMPSLSRASAMAKKRTGPRRYSMVPEIRSAKWGTGGADYKDKTDLLVGYLQAMRQDLRASNECFHDDYPSHAKHLIVQSRREGSRACEL